MHRANSAEMAGWVGITLLKIERWTIPICTLACSLLILYQSRPGGAMTVAAAAADVCTVVRPNTEAVTAERCWKCGAANLIQQPPDHSRPLPGRDPRRWRHQVPERYSLTIGNIRFTGKNIESISTTGCLSLGLTFPLHTLCMRLKVTCRCGERSRF